MAKRYQLITATSFDDFEEMVNRALAEGWKCQGGVAITETQELSKGRFDYGEYQHSYAQALQRPTQLDFTRPPSTCMHCHELVRPVRNRPDICIHERTEVRECSGRATRAEAAADGGPMCIHCHTPVRRLRDAPSVYVHVGGGLHQCGQSGTSAEVAQTAAPEP